MELSLRPGHVGQSPLALGGAPLFHRPSTWQAPLVPAALAVTGGIVTDRYAEISSTLSLACLAGSLLVFSLARRQGHTWTALICLGVAGVSAGAALHRNHLASFPAEDIGHIASDEPQLA